MPFVNVWKKRAKVKQVSKAYNENLIEVIRLTRQMMVLADLGDEQRPDEGCGVLFGTLRDSAYKLRKLAERERDLHIQTGCWDCDETREK